MKKTMLFKIIKKKEIEIFLTLYFLLNSIFLTKYPFMHSDESWLSGLSRNYLEKGSPVVTETFFDLLPRFPHSIKIIFQYIQVFFINILGYNLFTVRLISLIFSIISLYLLYKLGLEVFKSKKMPILLVLIVSIDIHFIYTSHFARQEIVILFVILLSIYLYIRLKDNIKKPVILGIITGLSIGIHPNSLFVAAVIGSFYFYDILISKKIIIKNLIIYIATVGLFALFFVFLSLNFDPNFFSNYKNFGDQFNIFAEPSSRITEFKNFYIKLFYQVSGTYYIPNIKLQLILFPILFIFNFIKFIVYKDFSNKRITGLILFSIIAVNITYIVIGRYNQTSIIFIFPLFWTLFILTLKNIKYNKGLYALIASLLLIISILNINPFINDDYNEYLSSIGKYINSEDKVLANLNSEFYFKNGKLLDYRNLHYLKENNISFGEYIDQNNIEYIVYPEEMDFIYNSRPVWNFIYGNLYYYYEDMHDFFSTNCKLIDEFKSPYAMRLSMYMYEKEWSVKIYRVN